MTQFQAQMALCPLNGHNKPRVPVVRIACTGYPVLLRPVTSPLFAATVALLGLNNKPRRARQPQPAPTQTLLPVSETVPERKSNGWDALATHFAGTAHGASGPVECELTTVTVVKKGTGRGVVKSQSTSGMGRNAQLRNGHYTRRFIRLLDERTTIQTRGKGKKSCWKDQRKTRYKPPG